MSHCKPEQLSDVEIVLDEIKKFDVIKEKKKGVFYLKSKAFLHFHVKENKRWADARCGKSWGEPIILPFNPSEVSIKKFLKTVKQYYLKTSAT